MEFLAVPDKLLLAGVDRLLAEHHSHLLHDWIHVVKHPVDGPVCVAHLVFLVLVECEGRCIEPVVSIVVCSSVGSGICLVIEIPCATVFVLVYNEPSFKFLLGLER